MPYLIHWTKTSIAWGKKLPGVPVKNWAFELLHFFCNNCTLVFHRLNLFSFLFFFFNFEYRSPKLNQVSRKVKDQSRSREKVSFFNPADREFKCYLFLSVRIFQPVEIRHLFLSFFDETLRLVQVVDFFFNAEISTSSLAVSFFFLTPLRTSTPKCQSRTCFIFK